MKEAKIIKKFEEKVRILFPDIFFVKIRDSKGITGKLCFDGFFLIKHLGKKATFCFEAKSGRNKVTPYQRESLKQAEKAGAFILIIRENYNVAVSNLASYFLGDIKSHRRAIKYFRETLSRE